MTLWPDEKPADHRREREAVARQGRVPQVRRLRRDAHRPRQLRANFEVCPHCGQHHKLAAARLAPPPPRRRRARRVGRAPRAGRPARVHRRARATRSASPRRRRRRRRARRSRSAARSIEGRPIAYGAFLFAFMGGLDGLGRRREGHAPLRARDSRAAAGGAPPGLRRRPDAGGHPEPDADGQERRRARALCKARGLPFISVLLHPTTGGVAASFALLGDVNIAEPKALIGFAGPRVIESTIRQTLPEGFQRSEFLLAHGMVDRIVSRLEMKREIAKLVGHLAPARPPARQRRAPRAAMSGRVARPCRSRELYARIPLGMRLGLDAMREACARAGTRSALRARPRRRHQRQGQRLRHGRGRRARGRAAHRPLHLAAPLPLRRAHPRRRRAADRRRARATSSTRALDAARPISRSSRPQRSPRSSPSARRASTSPSRGRPRRAARRDQRHPRPRATAITRIALEHTDRLGTRSSTSRARRRAIAKPGLDDRARRPCHADVRAAIDEVARAARRARSTRRARAVRRVGPRIALCRRRTRSDNARVACGARRAHRASRRGDRRGLRATRWPGRLERIETADGSYAARRRPQPRRRERARRGTSRATASRPAPGAGRARLRRAGRQGTGPACSTPLAPPRDAPRLRRARSGPRSRPTPPRSPRGTPGTWRRSVRDALAARARGRAAARGRRRRGSLVLVGEARAVLLGTCRATRRSRFERTRRCGSTMLPRLTRRRAMPSFDIVSKVQWSEVDNA